MKIEVDGFPREVPDGATVGELLRELDEPTSHVIVEINGSFLPAERYEQTSLEEGDRVEVIYPAFGG